MNGNSPESNPSLLVWATFKACVWRKQKSIHNNLLMYLRMYLTIEAVGNASNYDVKNQVCIQVMQFSLCWTLEQSVTERAVWPKHPNELWYVEHEKHFTVLINFTVIINQHLDHYFYAKCQVSMRVSNAGAVEFKINTLVSLSRLGLITY